jgi:hypothetical protein
MNLDMVNNVGILGHVASVMHVTVLPSNTNDGKCDIKILTCCGR